MMNITIQEYSQARATETMHSAPRFGHSDAFSNLFSDKNSDVQDYGQGLIFIGALVLSIFVTWCAVLLVLKCLGKKKVGFLSGHAFRSSGRRSEYVRLVFVSAGILFITFTILLVTQGLTKIQNTVTIVNDSNQDLKVLFSDAHAIASSLRSVGESSGEVRDLLVSNLGEFCPGDPNVEEITGSDFDALASEAIDLLNQLDDFVKTDVEDLMRSLNTATNATSDVDDVVEKIEAKDWQSLVILIPYILLASLMLLGTMMAWFDVSVPGFTWFLSWIVLPIFCVATVFAFVACASISFLAVANADFCSGGSEETPDQTVRNILDLRGVQTDDTVYRAVQYYLSKCVLDNPWDFIMEYDEEIATAQATVQDLSNSFQMFSVEQLSSICEKDFGPFEQLLTTMEANLSILDQNTQGALDLLSCERILPIYTNTVYSGTCSYSVTGVTWAFSAFLVIAFMGMIMIMFRSSYLEDDFVGINEDLNSSTKDPTSMPTEQPPHPSAPFEMETRSFVSFSSSSDEFENPKSSGNDNTWS